MSNSKKQSKTPPLRYNGEHYHDPTAAAAIENTDPKKLYCRSCGSSEHVDVISIGIYGKRTPDHKTAEICLCKKCQRYFTDLFHSRVERRRKKKGGGKL